MNALVLGDKQLLSEDVKYSYSVAGASHVLAVSGLHVGVLVLLFNFIVSFFIDGNLYRRRLYRTIIIVSLLWMYVWLIGGAISVCRSALMFSFANVSFSFRRKITINGTLIASAFLLLLYNPLNLYDVGFQLSYIAVFSIVYFEPKVSALLKPMVAFCGLSNISFTKRIANIFVSLVSVTLAAQLGTAPLVMFYFHQFSYAFLLSGLLIVPLVSLVLYVAILFFALSWIPGLSSLFAMVLSNLVLLMNKITNLISSLAWASNEWISFDEFDLFVAFSSLFFLILYFNKRNIRTLFVSLMCVCIFVCRSLFYCICPGAFVVSVYNFPKATSVNLFCKDSNIIYCRGVDTVRVQRGLRSFWIKEHTIHPLFVHDTVLSLGGRTIFILNNEFSDFDMDSSACVDYLVVSNDVRVEHSNLIKKLHYGKIIVDSSCSKMTAAWWRKNYSNVYCVYEEGDFVEHFW